MRKKANNHKNTLLLTRVIFGSVACPHGENPFAVTGNLDINK